jgi:hypothetical protein
MIIRKLTEPIFIHFSKMYIYFYEDKRDYWIVFPSVILAALFSINLEILSFYVITVPRYYYVCLGIFFVIFFVQLYKNTKYEYVKNYKMPMKTRIIISLLILLDIVIIFTCLNIMRNGKFMW